MIWFDRLRVSMGPLWWHTAIMFVASRLGDLLNLYVALFYLPAALSRQELGVIEPVTRLISFGSLPAAVISYLTVTCLSSYLAAGELGKIKRFLRDMTAVALGYALLFVMIIVLSYEGIQTRLHVSPSHLLLGLCALALAAAVGPLANVMLQGLHRFRATALIVTVDPLLRLGLCVTLVPLLGLAGYLLALFAAGASAVVIAVWNLREFTRRDIKLDGYGHEWRGLAGFVFMVTVFSITSTFQGFIEPFLVRNFLSVADSAAYYLAMRMGSIPMFALGPLLFVLYPLLSKHHAMGAETDRYLIQSVGAAALVTGLGVVGLRLGGRWALGLRAEWIAYQGYSPFFWKMTAAIGLATVANVYITHEIACRRFRFLRIFIPTAILECGVLYGLFGWGAFRGMLPAGVWQAVHESVPKTLDTVVFVMIVQRVVMAAGFAMEWRSRRRESNR